MNLLQKKMVEIATDRYQEIDLCETVSSLEESFTEVEGTLYFWFNDRNKSTHVVTSNDVDELVKYLSTELEQIEHDYALSGSDKELEEYALEWVSAHGAEFEAEHPRNLS